MTKKALIVDDSRTAYMVLARILANYNIEGIHAKSGDEAIEFLAKKSVDVIFLDQAMPGKDGFDTIKEIKQGPTSSNIPVMMFTARTGDSYEQEVLSMGAVGVLPKELSAEEVEEALDKLNLWGAVSGQTLPEQVEDDLIQPSSDEKLRVWLESFLENEFSPQLSNKVRKVTDDLRRDTIHYGKRMLDEIAKTDKQQQMLQEVKGQTDYLKQLFLTSFKQYRLISSIFIVVLTLLVLGLVWIGYQQTKLSNAQTDLYAEVSLLSKQRLDGEMRLSEQIDQRLISLEQIMSDDLTSEQADKEKYPSYSLYTDEGEVGQIIGMEQQGRWITAKSAHGYLFAISPQGKISGQGLERYYLERSCAGLAYVNAMAGVVLRVNSSRLGYTELNGHNLMQQPSSWSRGDEECQTYTEQEALVLRPLLDNEATITGVEDTLYSKGD